MKRIKRLASLMLALVMAMAMTVTAFAADNNMHTITVTQNAADKTVHTYDAYQIFAGDLAEKEGKMVLSNIIWGKGVNGDVLLAALQADETFNVVGENKTNAFAECKDAADVAEVLGGTAFANSTVGTSTLTDAFARVAENNLTDVVAGTATGTGNVEITVTGSGYYLVKDQNGTVDTANGAYTRFMLEVVGDATATVKSEVPSGDKKVYIVDGDGNIIPDDANYATIGSHVSYVITSKVPNYVGYDYYYFIMNDTLSTGLDFDGEGSVTVKVGDTELIRDTDYYVYTEDVAPYTFRIAFADIMETGADGAQRYPVGSDITVTYSATVTDEAKVGTTGNPNTWNLQYSNNPNENYDGTQDSSRPGLPADENNTVLGQTPDEKTLTFLTELDITKYANEVSENNLLPGAEFTLTGVSEQVVLKNVEYYVESETGTYYLLKDGTYTTTAPTGTEYVEIGVGTADTETGYIKDADGKYVVPTDKNEYNGATIYKLVKGTAEDYLDVNTKYERKTETVQETIKVPVNISIEMTTKDDGKITFKGLGAGKYTLTETVTPSGYNTIDPIEFEIVFTAPDRGVVTGQETCIWDLVSDKLEYTEGGNVDSLGGIFSANIINKSGSLLPSTGGIGTTIFYVVGGILVVAAGILLVTKKRMSAR